MIASAVALAPIGMAQAATFVSVSSATPVYSGPTPTYDFETMAPISGGTLQSATIGGVAIQPIGSTGNFYAVGGVNGSPATLSLSDFPKIGSLSFLWGTPDDFNMFEILDAADSVVYSVTGTAIKAISGPSSALVTFNFTDSTVDQVSKLRFTSSRPAFEFDNIAVAPIPESGVWAMMLIGFAAMGFSLRRREKTKVRVRYA